MTAYGPAPRGPEQILPLHFVAAGGLIRPLAWLSSLTVAAAGIFFVLSSPMAARLVPSLRLPDLRLATGALLLAALGLVSCLRMVMLRWRHTGMGQISAWPQSVITVLFGLAATFAVLADEPLIRTDAPGGFTLASILLMLATPLLLAERMIAALMPERLPERDDLRSLLFVPVFFSGAQAMLIVAASLGFVNLSWVRGGLSAILLLICLELTLRVLAGWFQPPPDSIAARAAIGSILAAMLRGRALSPAAVASTLHAQFGMDFSRSWALQFMRTTAIPVALLMLVFCWCLTGVNRVDLNQRDAYERFGSVATILKPGLHLTLPWPFGVVRPVELGVIHSVLISNGDQGASHEAADPSTAEGDAPANANRLWDSEQPTDVSYIIASSDQARQSFQTVSASVRVLYRIGLDDPDARAALYRDEDPDALVRALTGRLLARFFAARTLPSVLGESQGIIAADIKASLRQALENLASGIDVVAVTIETIHPPAGAASAYRNVQAAEIEATTSIATERGRAVTTVSIAQRDAHSATGDAAGSAAETVSAAQVDLTGMTADDRPYRAAAKPFLLERYFTDIQAALANVPLVIIDHRLTGASVPTIDLRPPGAGRDSPIQAETKP